MKKNFLLASWLFGLGNSFSAPLLGLYIYINSSVIYTIDFLLVSSVFILTGYIVVGYLSSVWKRSTTYYVTGAALYIVFYLTLFALGRSAPEHLALIGPLYGIAQGFYWSGWDVVFYNTPKKLNFFNKSSYLGFITGLVSPGVYGGVLSVLHNSGYGVLFLLTAVLLLFSMAFVEDIPIDSVRLSLRNAIKVLDDNRAYKETMVALAVISGVNYVMGSLNVVLLYSVSKSYFDFTLLNYVLTSASILSVYVLRDRLVNKVKHYKLVLTSSVALVLSGPSVLLGAPIIYLLVFSVTSPLIYPVIDVVNWNNMDRRFLMDYLVNRQILLNTGRILSSLSEAFITGLSPNEGVISLLPLVLIASLIFAKANSKKQVALEG